MTENMAWTQALLTSLKSAIPPLLLSYHKGQAGRIGVVGGCQDYTGAPYFAAISSLKVGADLCHVFCTKDAAPVIKSYSPELIVHPILDSVRGETYHTWLERLHSLVIGPGLGTDEKLHKSVQTIIDIAKGMDLPLVLDAEAVSVVASRTHLLHNYKKVILTPNLVEFDRLYKKLFRTPPSDDQQLETKVSRAATELGHVTIVCKGSKDIISDGHNVLVCDVEGGPRRCGGQGDLLAGSMAVFHYWCKKSSENHHNAEMIKYGPHMIAAYAACAFTRECNRLAFEKHRRSTLTSDMINCIQQSFESLFM